VGDAGEVLQHDDLEGKASDSVRKKNAVKPCGVAYSDWDDSRWICTVEG
jgi:hypothetical protein